MTSAMEDRQTAQEVAASSEPKPARRKAGGSDKKTPGFRWRGWMGILVLVPLGVITLLSWPRVREDSWPDLLTDVLAWVAFVAGAGLRIWSSLYLAGRKRRVVVSEGPYSICRNPQYLGSFLLAISAALFLKGIVFGAGIGLAFIWYMWATVPVEEKYLRGRLGEEYIQYCGRVPRFWPRLSQFRTPEMIEVNVRHFRIECTRAAAWIWLPLVCEVLTHLRWETWWPHLFRLP